MYVICAETIQEAERDLEAMKSAVRSGVPCGAGGDTMCKAYQAMEMMEEILGLNEDDEYSSTGKAFAEQFKAYDRGEIDALDLLDWVRDLIYNYEGD